MFDRLCEYSFPGGYVKLGMLPSEGPLPTSDNMAVLMEACNMLREEILQLKETLTPFHKETENENNNEHLTAVPADERRRSGGPDCSAADDS